MHQGGGPWLGHLMAMSTAIAASALPGNAGMGGPSLQQGSTHFTNCHFTHAMPAYAGQSGPAHATTMTSQAITRPAQICKAAAASHSALSNGDAQAGDVAKKPQPSDSPAQSVSKSQKAPGAQASTVGLMASQVDQNGTGRASADLEAGSAPARSLIPGEAEPHKQSSMRRRHGQVVKRRVRFQPAGAGTAAGSLGSCTHRGMRTGEPHRAGNSHMTTQSHTARAAAKGKEVKTRDRLSSGSKEGQAAQSAEVQQEQQQQVFDYAHALAALDEQHTGSLRQLSCAGEVE